MALASRSKLGSSFAGLIGFTLLAVAGGCSAIVETDVKAGIGSSCKAASECQGESVECSKLATTDATGICTSACTASTDCPTGSVCSTGRCQAQLKIGAIYIGNSGEGWTKTHADGLSEVSAALGYPSVTAKEGVVPGPDTQKLVEEYIAAGNKVIVATSTSYNADIVPLAAAHPDVKFLVCEGTEVKTNLGSYYGRREQAWYLAGQVAAQASASGKLGVVGTFVSPDNVRNINAYLLGARAVKSEATVEIRWSGFWFDYSTAASFSDADPEQDGFCTTASPCYLEAYLTDKLLAGGVEVITHQADVDRAVNFVEDYNAKYVAKLPAETRPPNALSVANNNRYGCHAAGSRTGDELASCLSAVYWNWTPLYTQLFSQMEYQAWTPQNIYLNIQGTTDEERENSIVGLEQSGRGAQAITQFDLNKLIRAVAVNPDPYAIFSGNAPDIGRKAPYKTNGRPAGDVTGPLNEDEVLTMCWFADGVVEQPNDACSENPKGESAPGVPCAPIAATVPRGERSPWKALPPFGETGNAAFSCVAHGGK